MSAARRTIPVCNPLMVQGGPRIHEASLAMQLWQPSLTEPGSIGGSSWYSDPKMWWSTLPREIVFRWRSGTRDTGLGAETDLSAITSALTTVLSRPYLDIAPVLVMIIF